MHNIKWSFIILLGAILLLTVPAIQATTARAALDTYEFTVNNTTAKSLTVSLLGPKNYVIPAPPGKTRIDVLEGRYQYSYYDCGGVQIGQINILKKGVGIKLLPCDAPSGAGVVTTGGATVNKTNVVEFTINNRTIKNLNVSLLGSANYRFPAPPGKGTFEIIKGKYQLSYYDCGGLIIETINVTKDTFLYKIKDCSQSGGGTGASQPTGTGDDSIYADGTLMVNNKSGRELYLYLRGVQYHTLQVPPGKSKFNVGRGFYVFSYYACGKLNDGSVNVKKQDSSILITRCGSTSNGQPVTDRLVVFKVKNNTGVKFDLRMFGPQDYTFLIRDPIGGTFEVHKGIYSYTYTVCGASYQGIINLNTDGLVLKAFGCKTGN